MWLRKQHSLGIQAQILLASIGVVCEVHMLEWDSWPFCVSASLLCGNSYRIDKHNGLLPSQNNDKYIIFYLQPLLLCPYGNSKRQNWCDPDSWCETQWKKSVKEIRFEIYPRDKNSEAIDSEWDEPIVYQKLLHEQVKLLENWNQMVDKSCTSLVYPWSILPLPTIYWWCMFGTKEFTQKVLAETNRKFY